MNLSLDDENKLKKIKDHAKKIEYFRFTNNNLLYWDRITQMPSKGISFRTEVMTFFAGELHKLSDDKEFIDLVNYFENMDPELLDIETNSMIRKIKRNYDFVAKIPVGEYKEYIKLITIAENVWSEAKKNNDFQIVVPYIEKIVAHFQNFAEYWGYEEEPYDALLSYYETGVTLKEVDLMFTELRDFIIDLLKKINSSKVEIKDEIFSGHFDKNNQIKMTVDLLNRIGFDFEAGRIDEGVHPTILVNSNKDVRIITSYIDGDFRPTFTTALHAGGQGLYEQGISSNLYGTLLAESSSVVILEGIARFYENIFGKSKSFWSFYESEAKKFFPILENETAESIFKSINKVEPSLIRMDADELTYNLHIIIRYEIERDLLNGNLKVKDIPEEWNKKYKAYLGIEAPNHETGSLQDVHWFSGYFGYFPSYVLGNFYAAQIFKTMKKEILNYEELVSKGDWLKINEWFNEKIFLYGAIYNPQEIIYIISDEKLKAKYFIDYLREKYKSVYEI